MSGVVADLAQRAAEAEARAMTREQADARTEVATAEVARAAAEERAGAESADTAH